MTDRRRLLNALWSTISSSPSPTDAPAWFVRMVEASARHLPASVAEDFVSLIAVEMLTEFHPVCRHGTPTESDLNRLVGRVRQRLLTEIGFTSRAFHRRSAPLTREPESKSSPRPEDELTAKELLLAVKNELSPFEGLVLALRIEGRSSEEIAAELSRTTRTIQRALLRIHQVIMKPPSE